MKMKYSLLIQAAVLSLTAAAPVEQYYAVKETHVVPPSFTRVGDAPDSHRIRLSVGLTQSRFDELERHLYEVSDPYHSRYGQHLSQEDVNELIKPSEESLALVQEWLHQHVAPERIEYSPASDFLTFTLPVADVERLLNTKYSTYRHVDGDELVRTSEWSLPIHLLEHITAIQPTTSFLRPTAQMKTVMTVPGTKGMKVAPAIKLAPNETPSVAKACDQGSVTPDCLRTLYGTINYVPKAGSKNQIALNDFLGEINNRSDAKIYLQNFRPEALSAATDFTQISVDGGTLQQTPETKKQLIDGVGLEGNLDLQTIIGISYPVPATAYSTKGKPPPFIPDAESAIDGNEPYLMWLHYILKQSFIPQVVSNSYADNEQTVPISYAKVVCSHFAQLGARGVSVFFGAGDGGVTGVQNPGACKSNVNGQKEFVPLFPASCPYVTTVGATVNFEPEVVAYDPANGFRSGGGFSNYFGRPSFQSEVVEEYLKFYTNQYPEYEIFYNKSGRAYPDIAAYGVNYTIAWNGSLTNVDGTSAATPAMAAIFTLVNDALIASGKSPLGWLNPWLYSKGKGAFTDVTSGNTAGCNTTGYVATTGWDAASGFGTPNFGKLLKLAGVPSSAYGGGQYPS